MLARDVMTRDVRTVGPDTPIHEIAELLLAKGISAVPVVDSERHVLGIVSEGDLMRRAETGTDRRSSWWLELVSDSSSMARAYVKSHGLTARQVMTRHVASVSEETPIAAIAELLESKRIKRVPVISAGKLVGLVSRADLLRALVQARHLAPASGDDRAIRAAIEKRLSAEPWSQPLFLNIVVQGGKVELWGRVESEDQRRATVVLAQEVAGIKAVADHLGVGPIGAEA